MSTIAITTGFLVEAANEQNKPLIAAHADFIIGNDARFIEDKIEQDNTLEQIADFLIEMYDNYDFSDEDDDPEVTPEMVKMVADEMGHELPAEEIAPYIKDFLAITTYDLKQELASSQRRFNSVGGRGVELADWIDGLRIVLAARGELK